MYEIQRVFDWLLGERPCTVGRNLRFSCKFVVILQYCNAEALALSSPSLAMGLLIALLVQQEISLRQLKANVLSRCGVPGHMGFMTYV